MPTHKKEFGGLVFEWDTDKELLNIKQHDVSFDEALSVLLYDDFAKTNEEIPENMTENNVLLLWA